MRKLCFTAALFVSCLSIQLANAQVRVRANVNIGSQPEWGPVGYNHADYYYMPDIDAYYDVSQHQYVYNDNNNWVHSRTLPAQYGNYDRYHSYKVVVNQQNPWEHHDEIRSKYENYKGRHDQVVIRDSRDNRYRKHWKDDDDNKDRGDREHHDNQ
ncbi:MAG: hypothetical protein JWP94_3415 [Mucilaginibacter sp.]|nr:hypothetical protein [Mucilaginibacter sp.]